jgi:hypothetical protein
MNDKFVRKSFHNSVLKKAHTSTDILVVDEMGLRNGESRADIAVIGNQLIGYEIKSEKDNLNRLKSQIIAYNEVFDKVFIITSEKHLYQVINLIPDWWGIYIIKPGDAVNCEFSYYRPARINKVKNSFGLVQLLWKDEASHLLSFYLNHRAKQSNTKLELYNLVTSRCTTKDISLYTIQYLKSRQNWRINLVEPLQNDDYSRPNSTR